MKSEGVVLTKEAVSRLVNLEAKHAAYKATQLEICYLCESLNQMMYSQVKSRPPTIRHSSLGNENNSALNNGDLRQLSEVFSKKAEEAGLVINEAKSNVQSKRVSKASKPFTLSNATAMTYGQVSEVSSQGEVSTRNFAPKLMSNRGAVKEHKVNPGIIDIETVPEVNKDSVSNATPDHTRQ